MSRYLVHHLQELINVLLLMNYDLHCQQSTLIALRTLVLVKVEVIRLFRRKGRGLFHYLEYLLATSLLFLFRW